MSGSSNTNEAETNAPLLSVPTRRLRKRRTHDDVEALTSGVYEFSDLSIYSPKDQFIIEAADLLFYSAISTVCATLQWEVHGIQNLNRILESQHRPIFVFWHECIFSATYFWRDRGIVVMSSISRDAEYTGRVIKRFGYGTSRGSSTRGGGRALAEMAECLNNGFEVGFTIDGPRGPALQAKPGAVTLARHTGHAILPFHISTKKHYTLPSWDRLQVPVPFTSAIVQIAEPIYVSAKSTTDEVAQKQSALQESLSRLREQGEAWRARRH